MYVPMLISFTCTLSLLSSLLQVLIDHNADVNLVDRLGYCPLYLALQGGRGDLVETILMADPKMDVMTGVSVVINGVCNQ